MNQCKLPRRSAAIAARKAQFLSKNQWMKPHRATKRVLHEIVAVLSSIMEPEEDENENSDNVIATFFVEEAERESTDDDGES